MKVTRIILIVLAFLLLAAHFSRAGSSVLAAASLIFPLLLQVRRPWAGWTLRIALVLGGFEWLRTLINLVSERRSEGEDWIRMAVIVGAVALITFLAAKAVRVPPPEVEPSVSSP